MPSEHKGTLSVVGKHVKGVFVYQGRTYTFEGTLIEASKVDFTNLSATLMLGGPPIEEGPIDFTGDFGPGGIVIAMDSIAVSINAQLANDIEPYFIPGSAKWVIDFE